MKNPDIDQRYAAAKAYYEKEDYYRAGLIFEDLISSLLGDARAENVQFSYAYTNFYQQQYQLSAHYFRSFFDTYGRSPHAEEALYMHTYSLYKSTPAYYLDQSNTNVAINALQDFLNRYPESTYKKDASDNMNTLRKQLELKAYKIAKQYQKLSRFKAAVLAYSNFMKDFPDSEFREEVIFRKIVATYELARISIESKKEERYQEMRKNYLAFVDRYPESSYIKAAEKYFGDSRKALQTLKTK